MNNKLIKKIAAVSLLVLTIITQNSKASSFNTNLDSERYHPEVKYKYSEAGEICFWLQDAEDSISYLLNNPSDYESQSAKSFLEENLYKANLAILNMSKEDMNLISELPCYKKLTASQLVQINAKTKQTKNSIMFKLAFPATFFIGANFVMETAAAAGVVVPHLAIVTVPAAAVASAAIYIWQDDIANLVVGMKKVDQRYIETLALYLAKKQTKAILANTTKKEMLSLSKGSR